MNNRFCGKVVVITGAGGGIGKAVTARFLREGAKVILAGRRTAIIEEAMQDIEALEDDYLIVRCDISNEKDVESLMNTAIAKYGKIDIVFNNAGIVGPVAELQEISSEEMMKVININVMGTFYGIKSALKIMRKQGFGVIINTSSIAGHKGQPNTAAYVASKHAITGLTRAAAAENVRNNIRVCAVCPAPVDTDMMKTIEDGMAEMTGKENKEVREMLSDLPMGRYATPDEVASAVLFLASDEASYITGTSMLVDGGFVGI